MKQELPKLECMRGDRFIPHHDPQTVTAVPFLHVDDRRDICLEGLIFDRDRNMYFTNINEAKIMKVDMESRKLSVYYEFSNPHFRPTAVKFHRDGRMFVAGLDRSSQKTGRYGGIYVVDPNRTDPVPVVEGVNVDDLVFDAKGGIYFSNYTGIPIRPDGTIEYLSPDFKQREIVMAHLAAPNGVCLSKSGDILWVTETAGGVLHRFDLKENRRSGIVYHFEGFFGPDSCSIDADDNVYVAMARQGRVLVFNPMGFLIGQVVMQKEIRMV